MTIFAGLGKHMSKTELTRGLLASSQIHKSGTNNLWMLQAATRGEHRENRCGRCNRMQTEMPNLVKNTQDVFVVPGVPRPPIDPPNVHPNLCHAFFHKSPFCEKSVAFAYFKSYPSFCGTNRVWRLGWSGGPFDNSKNSKCHKLRVYILIDMSLVD